MDAGTVWRELEGGGATWGTLYAQAGIAQVWLVDLEEGVIEVYSQPGGGKYGSVATKGRGETLELPGGLPGEIRVGDVLD